MQLLPLLDVGAPFSVPPRHLRPLLDRAARAADRKRRPPPPVPLLFAPPGLFAPTGAPASRARFRRHLALLVRSQLSLLEWRPRPVTRLPILRPSPTGDCGTCGIRKTCKAPCAAVERNLRASGVQTDGEFYYRYDGRPEDKLDSAARRRDNTFLDPLVAAEEPVPTEAEEEASLAGLAALAGEQREKIYDAIDRCLSKPQRETITLILREGKRPVDVSRIRGVAKPTVTISVNRSLKRLRAFFRSSQGVLPLRK